jgi:hypothetical protein
MEVDYDTLQVKDYSQFRYKCSYIDLTLKNIPEAIKMHLLSYFINLSKHTS